MMIPHLKIIIVTSFLFLNISYVGLLTLSNSFLLQEAASYEKYDPIEVPLAECAMEGTQTVTDPKIPNMYERSEVTTEDVWDYRIQAANLVIEPQTGISFFSVRDLVDNKSIPILKDLDISIGETGNMTMGDFIELELFNATERCRDEWKSRSPGGEALGIPVLNVRQFYNGSNQTLLHDIVGSGICESCSDPYRGQAYVIDLHYTSDGFESTSGLNNDSKDQTLAHELGHTLGLGHRNNDPLALMKHNWTLGTEGTVSNILINDREAMIMRNVASSVPGTIVNNQ